MNVVREVPFYLNFQLEFLTLGKKVAYATFI